MCRSKSDPKGKYANGSYRCDSSQLSDAKRGLAKARADLLARPDNVSIQRRLDKWEGRVVQLEEHVAYENAVRDAEANDIDLFAVDPGRILAEVDPPRQVILGRYEPDTTELYEDGDGYFPLNWVAYDLPDGVSDLTDESDVPEIDYRRSEIAQIGEDVFLAEGQDGWDLADVPLLPYPGWTVKPLVSGEIQYYLATPKVAA